MHISVGDKNLESLFSGKQRVVVPGFQRGYAWTLDQVVEFWTDLKDAAERGETHFWGPIVLLQEPGEQFELKLIDGQQRITTAMMMISLLRDQAFKLKRRIVREGTPGAQDVHTIVRNFLFTPPMYTSPKFQASYLVNDVLHSHVVSDPLGLDEKARPELTTRGKGLKPADKLATRELRKSYSKLKDLLNEYLVSFDEESGERANRILDFFTSLTSGFEIHSMILASEDDAYILFETLNDRGLQLNPSDLLKTLTLREIRQSKNVDALNNALQIWDEMVRNLGEYDFSKFLRHYLLTQGSEPVQAKKIFKFFKETIASQGLDGAEKNLLRLSQASKTYAKLLGEDEIDDPELQSVATRLNSFSETHRVFLLALLEAGIPLDLERKLFRATEYLASRWILAGENAQTLESHYQAMANKLRLNPSAETAQSVMKEMVNFAPSDSVLTNLIYRSDKKDLQRYFLRRIEESLGGATLSWRDSITIEHLAPQKPAPESDWLDRVHRLPNEQEDDFSYDEIIQQWGNLTLLEKNLNSSIQNAEWKKKLNGDRSTKHDGLNSSTMNINKDIIKLPVWDRSSIETRNTWVTAASLALVSKEWVETGLNKAQKFVM